MRKSFLFKFAHQRGMALLTALMFALLLGVVARGIMVLTLGAQSKRESYHKRAEQAAQAGLEYAKTRLAEDPSWRGEDASGPPSPGTPDASVTLSTGKLLIVESRGNVFGKLAYDDGSKARFHLRFNYQEGVGGPDGLDNPSARAWSNSPLLSINNLESSLTRDVPRVGQDGAARMEEVPRELVPARSALIQVRGEAGPGIDKAPLNDPFATSDGFVSTTTLSSMLKIVLNEPSGPAVLQAGSNIDFTTKGDVVVSTADDSDPNIRSKADVSVLAVDSPIEFEMLDGDIKEQDGSLSVNGPVTFSDTLDVGEEPASGGYTEIMWEDVEKPNPDGHKLAAGVYILLPIGLASSTVSSAKSSQELLYYDMDFEQFKLDVLGRLGEPDCPQGEVIDESFSGRLEPGTSMSQGLPISFNESENEIQITGDLNLFTTQAGTKDFVVMSSLGTRMQSGESTGVPGGVVAVAEQVPVGVSIVDAKLHGEGRILVLGAKIEVAGATLIGEKDLMLNTSELSVSQPGEQNLSLYFKGNIQVSSFNKNGYGNFDLLGTIYSWSDISFFLGDTEVPKWGNLSITGNLVAYGGEPGKNDPGQGYQDEGSMGQGSISLRSNKVDLEYDPTCVTQIVDPNRLGDSVRIASVATWGGQ